MRQLMAHEVVPRLVARVAGARVTRSRLLRTTGITESGLAMAIGDAEDRIAPVTLAYLPSVDGVDLRLTAWDLVPEEADRLLEEAARVLTPVIGRHCYGEGEADLAAVVLERLKRLGLRLAVAESCTGGLLGARITAIPGSSAVFEGGSIAYGNEVKTRDLGVDTGILAEHGAVSEPVVRAMAAGVALRFEVGAAIAITGIAGPDGGTPEKPVGTVWIAARLGDEQRAVRIQWSSSREEVRQRAAQAGLDLLRRMIDG
jgi:nicotinamide-nucleotide amidase